uniref:Uncharacterized protein n=1 Tax=Meloidogyne enterolobii TaxID=390850 RepID=A0A6V7VDR8_MELEN|nr:unnamed protein product [Meloidogyne enterolobii]
MGSPSSDSLSIGIPEKLNRFLFINLCISPMFFFGVPYLLFNFVDNKTHSKDSYAVIDQTSLQLINMLIHFDIYNKYMTVDDLDQRPDTIFIFHKTGDTTRPLTNIFF